MKIIYAIIDTDSLQEKLIIQCILILFIGADITFQIKIFPYNYC